MIYLTFRAIAIWCVFLTFSVWTSAQSDFGIGVILKKGGANDTQDISKNEVLDAPRYDNLLRPLSQYCSSVSEGNVDVMITELSCEQTPFVLPLMTRSEVPHVTFHEKSCPLTSASSLTLNQAVGTDSPADVIQEVVKRNADWKKVFIFYDAASSHLVDEVVDRISSDGVLAILYEMTSSDDVRTFLPQTVRPASYTYPYLVLCSSQLTEAILDEAMRYGLREYEYKWLIYQADDASQNLKDIIQISDNIVVVVPTNIEERQADERKMLQETLRTVAGAGSELEAAGVWSEDPSVSGQRCLSPYSKTAKQTLMQNVKSRFTPMDTRLDEYAIESSVQVLDGEPSFRQTAAWTASGELDADRDDLYINKFQGFNGKHFIFGCIEYSFFQFKETPLENGHWKWNGLVFELMDELGRILNFTYETWEVPDGAFGIEDADGNWNGLIGQVVRKEIDIAASVFSITAPRRRVVDFCEPIFYEDSAVIVRQPEEEDKLLLFFRPYKWQVWSMIIGSLLACAVCTYLVTILSPLYRHPKKRDRFDFNQGLFQLHNTVLYFYGAFVAQGGIWLPLAQSGRVLVGCFWFSCMVLVATYTGNLISFLAVSRIQLGFNTLHEMVGQSEIRWGTPTGVALVQLFRDADVEPYISVAAGNDPSPDYTEGLRRVKEENYAFIAEKSWYHAEAAKDCRLAMIKETFFPTNYGMAFPKDAPYLKIFDQYITKFKESGIMDRWTKKWTPQNLNCTGLKAVTTAKVVNLEDFQGAIYILCIGLGTGILVFLMEICTRCCRSSKSTSDVIGDGQLESGKEENDDARLDPFKSSFDTPRATSDF